MNSWWLDSVINHAEARRSATTLLGAYKKCSNLLECSTYHKYLGHQTHKQLWLLDDDDHNESNNLNT